MDGKIVQLIPVEAVEGTNFRAFYRLDDQGLIWYGKITMAERQADGPIEINWRRVDQRREV